MIKRFSITLIIFLFLTELGSAQPVGELFRFGLTKLEKQHPGSCGRQIQYDDEFWVQAVWRHNTWTPLYLKIVYYQMMDPDNFVWFYPSGSVIHNLELKANHPTMVVNSENRAIVVFESEYGWYEFPHIGVYFDYVPHIGAFFGDELPLIYYGCTEIEVICPMSAIDINDRIHIVSTEYPIETSNPKGLYYGWAELDTSTLTMEYCEEQVLFSFTNAYAADVAASPVSNRVAIGWLRNTSQFVPEYSLLSR